MKLLIIGDPHATPQELGDCQALFQLVEETAAEEKVDRIVILGDLYNTHSVVNTPVIDFWQSVFRNTNRKYIVLVGNHDGFSPTILHPHALQSHMETATVIDSPQAIEGWAAMPYFFNPEKFVEEACSLKDRLGVSTLFCHQTFDGAKLQEGFYAKDGVNPTAVPFKQIISGHIHTPMNVGKVWYPGSPRWRTRSDANQDRFIYVVEISNSGYSILKSIPTAGICKKIYRFIDSEDSPAVITGVEPNSDIRIDVYGSQSYISDRTLVLKSEVNAKCRTFPTKTKRAAVTESDGIEVSFRKYLSAYVPPRGSDVLLVKEAVESRLGKT